MEVSGFDWDDGNWPKYGRHGVSQTEIEEVFRTGARIFPDVAHSGRETRSLAIGRSAGGRWVLAAFTVRRRGEEALIRPISARFMHRKEVAHYERSIQAEDDPQA